MNKVITGCFLVAVLAVPTFVEAQDTSSATLVVSGTVVSSISMTIESAGGIFTQGSTNAALTDLGSISKFGALPTNFSRTRTSSTWTLSSNIGILVERANGATTTYTLNGILTNAPDAGVVWKVNGFTLNNTTITALTAAGVYGSAPVPTYVWTIEIPDSMGTSTSIGNTITFSAISA